ncbi:MAG: ABC transporter substrate-binding protein [Nitrospirota bacterium]|jgi:peptide/nickel transport system substrate-binding protein
MFKGSLSPWRLCVLVLILVAAACARQGGHDDGGLTLAIATSPTSLDPRLATDTVSGRLLRLTHRGLVRLDERFRPTPDLATWEEITPLHYRFHLRPEVTFHDGRPLTADDVVATYRSLLDPALASPHRGLMEPVASVVAIDSATCDFILKRPHAPFLASLTLGIVPRGWHSGQPPPGTGPFRLTAWLPDQQLRFTRFADYTDGPVGLSGLTVRVLPDATVRALELERGGVDLVINDLPVDTLPRLASLPHLRLVTSPSTNFFYMGLNLQDPSLRDVRVRRAVACAIDPAPIIDHILRGQATPATGMLPPDHWAYHQPADLPSFDPHRARRLLDQARGSGAPPLRLEYKTSTDETARLVAQVIAQQLAQVGVDVSLRSYEWGTFYGDIKAGRFQLYCLTWTGVVEPDLYHYIFHSRSIPPDGANRNHYANPDMDAALEAARTTDDPVRRRGYYSTVQELAARDLPYIPLWHPTHYAVVNRRIAGFRLTPNIDFALFAKIRRREDVVTTDTDE